MKRWRLILFVGASLILISTGSFYVYRVIKSYESMQVLKIETFDSVWKEKFFDEKSKTIRLASDQEVNQLKSLAQTPSDKKKLKFTEISMRLMKLEDKHSSVTIDEIMQIVSDYRSNQNIDDDFAAQQEINQKILADSEKFIQDLTSSIQSLTISDDRNVLVYDLNTREIKSFSLLETSIKWEHLKSYNESIKSLNSAIEQQVKENQQSDQQTQIIELKAKFEKFLELIESIKESIKNDYFSAKDLKKIVKSIDKIDLSRIEWVTDSSSFGYRDANTQIVTSLSDKFFEDNPEIAGLKDLSKDVKIIVKVQVTTKNTNSKSEESRSQTMTISHTEVENLADESLIKKSTISNLRVTIKLDQSKVVYVEQSPSSSSSRSSSSSSERYESSDTESSSNEGR